MPTEQKINIVKNTTEKFKNSSGIYFTKYTGIDVNIEIDIDTILCTVM